MGDNLNYTEFKEVADSYLVEALSWLESLAHRATRVAGGDEGEVDEATAGKVSAIAEMAERATNFVAGILHLELRAMD
jgi:hypothetical protein